MFGAFELFGCEGVPIKSNLPGSFNHALKPEQSDLEYLDYIEDFSRTDKGNDFTLIQSIFNSTYNELLNRIPILEETPGLFNSHFAWHLSYLDKLSVGLNITNLNEKSKYIGTWLPFFYADKKRTFMVFPVLGWSNSSEGRGSILNSKGRTNAYYPEIKSSFRELLNTVEGLIRNAFDNLEFSNLTNEQKVTIANVLANYLGQEKVKSISDEDLKEMLIQFLLRIFRYILGVFSSFLFLLRRYHFKNLYHPFICDFIKIVL